MTEQIIELLDCDDFYTGNKLYKLIRTTYEDGIRTKIEYGTSEVTWYERYPGTADAMFLVIPRENREYPKALGEHKFDWEKNHD